MIYSPKHQITKVLLTHLGVENTVPALGDAGDSPERVWERGERERDRREEKDFSLLLLLSISTLLELNLEIKIIQLSS